MACSVSSQFWWPNLEKFPAGKGSSRDRNGRTNWRFPKSWGYPQFASNKFSQGFPTHHSLGVPPLMETHNYAENRFLNLILVSLCFSQFLDGRFNVVAPGIGASSFATFPVDHPPVAIGICPSESKLGTWWANMQVCPLILLMLGRGRSPV